VTLARPGVGQALAIDEMHGLDVERRQVLGVEVRRKADRKELSRLHHASRHTLVCGRLWRAQTPQPPNDDFWASIATCQRTYHAI